MTIYSAHYVHLNEKQKIRIREVPDFDGYHYDVFSDKIFRKDGISFGGGVLVYTSQGICVKERHDLNCDGVEMVSWIQYSAPIIVGSFKTLVKSYSVKISFNL
jgi:hypothetical protein